MTRPPLFFLIFASVACGEDSLSETFQPTEQSNENEPENVSPLIPGDFGFFVSSQYIPEVGAGGAGEDPSLSASANICVRIDEVRDSERAAFASAEETVLTGEIRLTGGTAVQPTLRDTINSSVDQALIDSLLTALWLKTIAYPTSTGLEAPIAETFTLEQGPRPDGDLSSLFFVEVRDLDAWNGFGSVAGDTLVWFQGPPRSLSDDDIFNNAVFDSRPPPESLLNTITLTWREIGGGSFPDALQGPVVHTVRLEFNASGVLTNAREVVVPDLAPEVDLDASSVSVVCLNGQPCLQGFLQDDAFDQLFCAF